jgi:hypothetical protein
LKKGSKNVQKAFNKAWRTIYKLLYYHFNAAGLPEAFRSHGHVNLRPKILIACQDADYMNKWQNAIGAKTSENKGSIQQSNKKEVAQERTMAKRQDQTQPNKKNS